MGLSLSLPAAGFLLVGGAIVIHFLLRGLFGLARPAVTASRVPRALVATVAAVAAACVAFTFVQRDAAAYHDDPSCSLGFAASVQPAGDSYGACHLEAASIVRAYMSYGRRSTHRELTVQRSDGSESDVEPIGASAVAMYQAAHAHTPAPATLQFFHGRIVAVLTDAGSAHTPLHPQAERQSIALFGIFAGCFGLVVSVATLVRSLF